MIATLAPGRISIQVTELGRNALRLPIHFMPDRTQGLEEALVTDQMALAQASIHFTSILTDKLHKGLQHRIQCFIPPR